MKSLTFANSLFATLLILAALWTPALAEEAEFVTEIDPYYTSAGLYFPLTDTPVPEIQVSNESGLFRSLFSDSLLPRFAVLEASVYPMPLLGVYLKEEQKSTYDGADITDRTNLIESVTTGFQEPAALTLFLGNVATLVKHGEAVNDTNKGYLGYLASIGNRHILNNVLIKDDWLELEIKLKGDRKFSDEKHSWSFRFGTRQHEHTDIADTLYVGIRRAHLAFDANPDDWYANSNVEFKTEFNAASGDFLRQEMIVGRKFPVTGKKYAYTLDLGVIWEEKEKYDGKLSDPEQDRLTLVIRPNIQF